MLRPIERNARAKLTAARKKAFKTARTIKLVVSGTATGTSPKTFGKTATAHASKTLR